MLQVGRYIQSKGGVVTAEELAPLLDPPEKSRDGDVDESYVVPALVRFGGSPEVDKQGNLLYRFESELPTTCRSSHAQMPSACVRGNCPNCACGNQRLEEIHSASPEAQSLPCHRLCGSALAVLCPSKAICSLSRARPAFLMRAPLG